MSDNIIVDTATRIFGDLCEPQTVNAAEEGRWPEELWNALEESGLTLTWVPDNLGGAGAEMTDGFAVLRVAGRFAAPVPLAETLMAGWLLAQAGISAPPGPMTVAPVHEDGNIQIGVDSKLRGRARHIQFGRPIAKFQAVQHNLATLAGEVAAAGAAADGAAETIASEGPASERALLDVAVAKVRVGEAASNGAAIAHQVHGAMGFTYEHSLHHATRRLWAWREEFGNETLWAGRLGKLVAEQGAEELWPFLTQGT